MRSPSPSSMIHQPFPISHITSSTIVLGSSYYSSSDSSDLESIPTAPSSTSSIASTTTSGLDNIFDTNKSTQQETPQQQQQSLPSQQYPSMAEETNNNNEISMPPFSSHGNSEQEGGTTSPEPPERCTSPRRDNSAIERIGREKVHVLRKEAQLMQDSLSDILDRIVKVKDDYDRLSSENKFLQDYIGNLMATSNILNKSSH